MKYLLLLMIGMSMNAHAEELNYYRIAANTLLVADWAQTRDIADDPNFMETNPILGENPTTAEVNRYFVGAIVLTNVIGESLEKTKHKNLWYGIISVNQLYYVLHNKRIGVSFRF